MKNIKKLFGLFFFSIILTISSCTDSDCAPSPVTASFTYSIQGSNIRTNGLSPIVVEFQNTSTNATSYSWNFGDGQTSTEENPTHNYTTYTQKTVTLTATNGNSQATATVIIDFPS
ncbi:MAG: PKD domain-containing protein [Chitinophagales bacterium]|nr:PKD domain-containing protein [Bacteroidota bacterium]